MSDLNIASRDILNNIKNIIGLLKENKILLFSTSFFFIILMIITYYIYYKYIKPKIITDNPLNKELIGKDFNYSNNDILIMLFKTEWCPYCKKAKPEWDKFQEYVNVENKKNNYVITLSVIDCDEKPDLAEKYKIEGYPTIKLLYKNEIYDYEAKPDFNNLKQFLKTSIDIDSDSDIDKD